MSVIVKTSDPNGLLKAIKKAIDDKHIETWEYDEAGHFTHITPDKQWYKKAWFYPNVKDGDLRFGLLGQKDVVMKVKIYGTYHGRFIEMLLNHFDKQFDQAVATAQGTSPDNFKGGAPDS